MPRPRTRECRARPWSRLPRGETAAPSLEEVVIGPTSDPSGQRNLFGALRRVMGKCGYSSVKEFQKAELILTGRT